ncbi:hypothetical protein [Methylobacterium nigriterrae]|uniref:hypothetical protein n=1 Tax=Methylobacterium nigriterrae TaxID=3127512 RepID=UPI003013BFE0
MIEAVVLVLVAAPVALWMTVFGTRAVIRMWHRRRMTPEQREMARILSSGQTVAIERPSQASPEAARNAGTADGDRAGPTPP